MIKKLFVFKALMRKFVGNQQGIRPLFRIKMVRSGLGSGSSNTVDLTGTGSATLDVSIQETLTLE